ncbi:hypothetical protein PR202_ga00372 [Eleusine coracana subsp. coracana]|uniref:Uncharacterized protein n=1 Tax=Eleusine coracana subsp. coracana TaxID=191504 RepID=A0AAV5BG12_ELECO|nr:hypothetical protein PR202_ga00372 [Eleusine coracana subsp. coracana]
MRVGAPTPQPPPVPAPAIEALRQWWLEDMGHMLDFVVLVDWTLELIDESLPDPVSVVIAIAIEAMEAIQLEPTRPRVSSNSTTPVN